MSLLRPPEVTWACRRYVVRITSPGYTGSAGPYHTRSLRTASRGCVVPAAVPPWGGVLVTNVTSNPQGTEFFFSGESGRIERHVESWEIKPMDALKQLVRPGRQIRKT